MNCKIFIVQFTFIGFSYINILFPLNFLHHQTKIPYIENDLFSRFPHFYKEMSFLKSQISIYFLYNLQVTTRHFLSPFRLYLFFIFILNIPLLYQKLITFLDFFILIQ